MFLAALNTKQVDVAYTQTHMPPQQHRNMIANDEKRSSKKYTKIFKIYCIHSQLTTT